MQKKLVHSTALSVLFGISSIIFGMKNDPADPYTHLTLTTIYNEFIVFSPSDLINQDKNAFEEDWTNRDFQQYIKQHNRSSNNNVTLAPTIFDFKPSQLIITDKNDTLSTLSVIRGNDKKEYSLGDFEKKQIEYLKYFHKEEGKIELFKTGWYYPINKIIHNDHLNNAIEIIDIASAAIVKYEKPTAEENICKQNIQRNSEKIEELKSKVKTIKISIFLCGVGIAGLMYLFSDRFIQFFHSFRNA